MKRASLEFGRCDGFLMKTPLSFRARYVCILWQIQQITPLLDWGRGYYTEYVAITSDERSRHDDENYPSAFCCLGDFSGCNHQVTQLDSREIRGVLVRAA